MPINSFSPPRIVIDTNSPAHAESSPHVRRTLDINRESDIHAVAGTLQTPISIHALRKESDPGTLRLTKRSKNFNPHSPCGERRHQHLQRARTQDFNPHSPCGERPPPWPSRHAPYDFNPHSPCGERRNAYGRPTISKYFNPHSPCGERQEILSSTFEMDEFQSTLPLRGATGHTRHHPNIPCYFNPHSPCGERLAYTYATPSLIWTLFQSTLPLRGATSTIGSGVSGLVQFQSTLPLRGATWRGVQKTIDGIFQSTLPLRGATYMANALSMFHLFQSTLPLRGATGIRVPRLRSTNHFNPHSPCGERLIMPEQQSIWVRFQSTLPLRGATFTPIWQAIAELFQSTLPLRGATERHPGTLPDRQISIHTPLAGSDRRNETFLTK